MVGQRWLRDPVPAHHTKACEIHAHVKSPYTTLL